MGNRSMPSSEFRGGMDRVAHPWQQKFKMTKSLKEDLVTGMLSFCRCVHNENLRAQFH